MSVKTLPPIGGARVRSPEWWVNLLYRQLSDRLDIINVYDDYYQGLFPLPWLAPQAEDDFRRILKMARVNLIGLVCDAQVERMSIEGFRIADSSNSKPESDPDGNSLLREDDGDNDVSTLGAADKEAWRIWQSNDLESFFEMGLLEATITGTSYLMVVPNPKDEKTPHMWVEHASQCIVAYEPGTNRRVAAAALKVWVDEWTEEIHATLYLPTAIFKYKAKSANHATRTLAPIWQRRGVRKESWPARNPLGIVPLFECPNNPRLLTGGRSEMSDLIDPQDRIIKTVADRLMTQDYGAFPQKWASGWPEKNDDGSPTAPIAVGRDRMITTEVVETKFGQFTAADIGGYISAKNEDVKDIASRSRTPAQYLLGDMSNVNGETLKASESGLVAKVRQRQRGHNGGVTNAVRYARQLAGLPTPPHQAIEVLWRNPEFRTEGELTASLNQMRALGVPEEALWERWGASPQERERWRRMRQKELAEQAAADATALLADQVRSRAGTAQPARGTGGSQGKAADKRNGATGGVRSGEVRRGASQGGPKPGGSGVSKVSTRR